MKKMLGVILLSLIVISVTSLPAMGTSTEWFHKYGILLDDSLNYIYFYFGVNADINLSKSFMITPEANLFVKPICRVIYFEPAVLFQVKVKNVFIGAGPMKLFRVAGDKLIPEFWGLKLNFGMWLHNMRIRLMTFSPFDALFKDNYIAAQVGFAF
jgi:hypothetical protein